MGPEGGSQGSRPKGCSRAAWVRNVPEACVQVPSSVAWGSKIRLGWHQAVGAASSWVSSPSLAPTSAWPPSKCGPLPPRPRPCTGAPAAGLVVWGCLLPCAENRARAGGEPGPSSMHAEGRRGVGLQAGLAPWELCRARPYGPPFTPGRKRAGHTSCRKPASRVGWRGALAGVRPGQEFRVAPGARPSQCFSAGFLGLQCDPSGPLTLLMVPGAPR